MKHLVDHQLEASVLGAVLRGRGSKDHLVPTLCEDDFDLPVHRAAFAAMLRLVHQRARIETRAVLSEAARGGASIADQLFELAQTSASPNNAEHFVTQLRSISALRAVAEIDVRRVVQEAEDGTSAVSALRAQLDAIDKRGTSRRLHTGADLAKRAFDRLEQARQAGGALRGLSTGFPDLDRALNGLRPGSLYLLAARPAMGKTALAVNMVSNVTVRQRARAVMFSLEMPADELADRILSAEGRIDSEHISAGRLDDAEWSRAARALGHLSDATIIVDDRSSIPIAEIAATARALHSDSPLGLVVVDYAQLARGSLRAKAPREQEVAEIAEGLKAIAKDLGVPVLALAQLNRDVEKREDKRPLLADLRESGQLEQAADAVLMLYRDGAYDESADQTTTEVIIRKHRHGPIGTVRLRWTAEMVRFDNAAPEYDR